MALSAAAKKALGQLRNRSASAGTFRRAVAVLVPALTRELKTLFKARSIDEEHLIGICILRSGAVFMDAFAQAFPRARIGMVGLRRDERTAKASWYYEHIPVITKKDTVVILDPMLATGGSAWEVLALLKKRGVSPARTFFLGVIAAPEGIAHVKSLLPPKHIVVASIDEKLDAKKFIVPGLGDFGDRFLGYSEKAK